MTDPNEPTDDERKNGWTRETLAAYRAERHAAASMKNDLTGKYRRELARPNRQNKGTYRPLRHWR